MKTGLIDGLAEIHDVASPPGSPAVGPFIGGRFRRSHWDRAVLSRSPRAGQRLIDAAKAGCGAGTTSFFSVLRRAAAVFFGAPTSVRVPVSITPVAGVSASEQVLEQQLVHAHPERRAQSQPDQHAAGGAARILLFVGRRRRCSWVRNHHDAMAHYVCVRVQ